MMIKICGLRQPAHAQAAVAAGADLIGLVFAPGRRQVTIAEAGVVVQAARATMSLKRAGCRVVGLFVNAEAAAINRTVAVVGLDAVQLSGDESPELLAAITAPLVLKSIRLDASANEQAWIELAGEAGAARSAEFGRPALALLVDANVAGAYGGTGALADWERAAKLAGERRLFLAGGLNTANVAEAIGLVRPWGVDVSSGVESNGVKDVAKIRAFIDAARAAV